MSREDELAKKSLFDELLRQRDEDRERAETGLLVVKGKDLPWEHNGFGKQRWYMHPAIKDTVIRNLMFYMQEIPPGSRTGRLKTQGNEVLLILQGNGYTTIDGVKHFWKAGDVVGLPVRERGLIIQHFNLDSEEPARFVAASPNLVDALGVERGVGFELLEESPDTRDPEDSPSAGGA